MRKERLTIEKKEYSIDFIKRIYFYLMAYAKIF